MYPWKIICTLLWHGLRYIKQQRYWPFESDGSLSWVADLSWPQPAAARGGASAPARDEVGLQQSERCIVAARPSVSERPSPFGFAEENSHKESGEQVFIRRKMCTVHVDRHAGGLRESRPRDSLSDVMGRFLQVSPGQSFWLAWFRVRIWYVSRSSHMCTHVS